MNTADPDQPIPPCEFRPDARNRRLKLTWREARGFLLSYPPRTSRRVVQAFLESNHQWMLNVLANKATTVNSTSIRQYLEESPQLWLDKREYSVVFQNSGGLMNLGENMISFYPGISENQLSRKLQDLAKAPLSSLLMKLAGEHELEVAKVQVRNQRSRWGSCSGNHSISLNWRLILMPHNLQSHIMLHELAHLVHPNHSSRFWALLEHWDPGFHYNKAKLQKEGGKWIRLGHN